MISAVSFLGGAADTSFGADLTLSAGAKRVQRLVATDASLEVILPDATKIANRVGGPVFYILNDGAETFTLRNSDSSLSAAIAAGKCATALLIKADSAPGTWRARISDIN